MGRISRRELFAVGGAAGAYALLAACGSEGDVTGGSAETAKPTGPLTWWDQFLPLEALEKKTFANYHSAGGPEVDYTVYNPNDQGKALQLAFQSKQMPDVFTLAGVNTASSALQQANWFTPLTDADQITKTLPAGSIIEGLNSFGGKVYSWPQNSFRGYDTLPWANNALLQKADIEPSTDTQSWDQFRQVVRKAQTKSGKAGLILPINFPARMATFVEHLAQVAGFPGMGGIEMATGGYRYDHDGYLQAIDYLKSFQTDKLLLSASSTLDARAGRLRWMAGDSVFFFDGPYNVGVIKSTQQKFLAQLSLWQIPTANGEDPVITNGPSGGTYWVSAASANRMDQIGKLLALFVSDEYRKGQAEAMDAAPIDLDAVASSNAHPTYKQCCAWYKSYGFLGPSPIARNVKVADVTASAKSVEPDLVAIVQGVMSGDVKDVKGALKTYSDAFESSREAAIKAKGGGKVSVDDWAFPDWQRGKDYTP